MLIDYPQGSPFKLQRIITPIFLAPTPDPDSGRHQLGTQWNDRQISYRGSRRRLEVHSTKQTALSPPVHGVERRQDHAEG